MNDKILFPGIRFFPLALLASLACGSRSQPSAEPTPSADSSLAAPAPTPVAPPSRPDSQANLLVVDSAGRTAALNLETTSKPGAASALISGSRNGEIRVVVPVGWTVRWNWRNSDSIPHSLLVMVQREKIPLEGGRPSLSNAMSRSITEGLAPGQTDQTTFVAEDAGWYWLMCGVPGHALAGEWIELRIDPEAKTARVERKNPR